MFTQDYLMRMILELAGAIRKSFLTAKEDDDPEGAAQLLEATLDGATEMDSSLLLNLEPDSMAAMLQISGSDPQLMAYVSRILLLESRYLKMAQRHTEAELRHGQAFAVANAFGIPLSEDDVEEPKMNSFLDSETN